MRTFTHMSVGSQSLTFRPIAAAVAAHIWWGVKVALVLVVVSCGPADDNATNSPEAAGMGLAPGELPPGPTSPASTSPSATPLCPTYDDDFLPGVQQPICSKCHGADPNLPDWGVYSSAKASCSLIGAQVASGRMPPRSSGLGLTATQRALVLNWVGLGCPKTRSELPASCGAGSMSPPPAPLPTTSPGTSGASDGGSYRGPTTSGAISITRAEWRSESVSLRLEGNTTELGTTLTAQFGGRSEALVLAGGRFRASFGAVATYPATVTVTSSSGASTTASVVMD